MTGDKGIVADAPREWFTPGPRYEGAGCAEFASPACQIRGPAVAAFDDSGGSVVYLDGDLTAGSDSHRGWRVLPLLSPGHPSGNGKHVVINSRTWCSNPCAELTIETPEGVFLASDGVHYGLSIPGENGHEVRLTFNPLRSEFRPADPGPARYWVLPLFNFVSDFVQRADAVGNHPLRVRPQPPAPQGLSEQESKLRALIADQKNRLIVFEFGGHPGFVEPLSDYEDRAVRLKRREIARTITAVMVGAVGDNSVEIAEVEQSWLPCHFLDLLSLASGSRVGAPWVEFRDAEGQLVRCFHIEVGRPRFVRGRGAMDERQYAGTGRLLTMASFPRGFTATDLRVVVRHLTDAWADDDPMEEVLGHVCRALDRLATATGVASRDMLDDMDDQRGQRVRDALRAASREVNKIAEEARLAGDAAEGDGLELISQWLVSRKATRDAGFGRAVLRLLERFALPDAQVIARSGKGTASRWATALSEYRGIPMHAGHFDVQSSKHDSDRLVATWWHLTDIAFRVLLKVLGYEGKYQPAVGIAPQAVQPLDWVRAQLNQRNLGYE